MIIDAHHHLKRDKDNLREIVDNCHAQGVDRICLFGAGRCAEAYEVADDADVLAAGEAHPDLVVPYATFDLGVDPPEKVSDIKKAGYRGIKFINPLLNYDDKECFPVYEKMEELALPAIFHLGIVARREGTRNADINSNRMRPIYLDTIARAFPGLTIVGAHLGNPWYEEASMAARWNPNLYFDLSGSTLKKKSPEYLGNLLWWTPDTRYRDPEKRFAWEKIVFGSDVTPPEIGEVLEDYKRVMDSLNVGNDVRQKVFGDTMARILNIGTP